MAQDTLIEQHSVMYSRYYVINNDNTFEFYFQHCTGLTFGSGNVKKGITRWKFKFDSLEIRLPFSECSSTVQSDSINFVFKSIIDNNSFSPSLIRINGRSYGFESNVKIAKNELVPDFIEILYQGDSLQLSHVWGNCSEITVYLTDNTKTIISGETEIFKKKKNSFYLRKITRNKDTEKSWRKGKRQKLIYRYELN